MFSWSCSIQHIRDFACKPERKYRHNKEAFSDDCCCKIRSEKKNRFYHNGIQCFIDTGCKVSWHAVQNASWWCWMHFMTWFWQLLGHPFRSWICVLSFPLHLEARHTSQNIEVPSHTSINHLCSVVFLCPSDDAKVKWKCSNNSREFYLFTLVANYQLKILYICYRF